MKLSAVFIALLLTLTTGGPVSAHVPVNSLSQVPSVWAAKPKISGVEVTVSGVATTNGSLSVSKVKSKPAGATYSVKWLRDGLPIPGATSKTYKVTKYDVGAVLTAQVTLKKNGYTSVTVKSAPKETYSKLQRAISTRWPGYPLIVNADSVDERISSWLDTADQYVAIAPGVYTPYNPAVENLIAYVETAPVSGDCMIKNSYFSDRGGACWDGVYAGSEEPEGMTKPIPTTSPRPTVAPAPAKPSASLIALWESSIRLKNLLIESNLASITREKGQKSVKEYQLTIATKYGDSLRAGIITGDLATINSRISILEAENSQLTAEIAELQMKINS